MNNKVTIGILTYNHEQFIETCVRSVLAIDYDNLEIVISDDCSKDRTFQKVQELINSVKTNHTIILNKNNVNLGLADNFNKIFYELASGDYLITLGGDDMLLDYDINEALKYFEFDELIMMVDFNARYINELDDIKGLVSEVNFPQKMFDLADYFSFRKILSFAPGRIFKRELINNFQPISKLCPTEDSVLIVRALLLGKLCRVNKVKVLYRRHGENISSSSNLRKMSNMRIIAQYIKDSLYLYDNNRLSDYLLFKLLRRFDFEFKRRQIIYSKKNRLHKYLFLKAYELKFFFLKIIISE